MRVMSATLHSITSTILPFKSYAICTHYRDAAGNSCGESFLIVPNGRAVPTLKAIEITFDKSNEPDYPFSIDANRILDEALGQANLDYDQHVQEIAERLPLQRWAPIEKNVEKLDIDGVFEVWLRSPTGPALKKVEISTKNSELRDFLASITKVSPFRVSLREV